ncbi:MAG: sulfite exporter TauE/SafE family protein [Spirochaetes bacterium]|nr:sulfite exporter TauE/SafE family protein [Spirochaetota bacterium]
MNPLIFIVLILTGLVAGTLGGFVGIGGGIIIMPVLMYVLGLSPHQAIGTSIAVLLPPIGIMAAYNYYRAGDLNLQYAIIIACAFILGGYAGSKMSLALRGSEHYLKLIFGLAMLYVSGRLIYDAAREFLGR